MRAVPQLSGLVILAVVFSHGSACAGGIHRGPASRELRESTPATPRPTVITPADRVRIQTVGDPERVPAPLRGKFVGTITDVNTSNVTVILEGGQPAVVHRALIAGLEKGVNHGARWKHTLIGAGVGAMFGALLGASSDGGDSGELIVFSPAEMALMGAIFFTPIGAIIGAVVPAGESWESVPLENVEWSPTR